MQASNKAKIQTLLEEMDDNKEITINNSNATLKINLKSENIELWIETLKKYSTNGPCNLLLACESDKCEIHSTRLTWVVGSAIRSYQAQSTLHSKEILRILGIQPSIVDLTAMHCPGLGLDIPWAFYLERHGWLTATPIIKLD